MVHCSVCGTRIYEQTDNFGGFPSSPSFNGWNLSGHPSHPVISDTCGSCHDRLLNALVVVANEIVSDNQSVVDQRRAELVAWQEQENEYAMARAEFELNYRRRGG